MRFVGRSVAGRGVVGRGVAGRSVVGRGVVDRMFVVVRKRFVVGTIRGLFDADVVVRIASEWIFVGFVVFVVRSGLECEICMHAVQICSFIMLLIV